MIARSDLERDLIEDAKAMGERMGRAVAVRREGDRLHFAMPGKDGSLPPGEWEILERHNI